MKNLPVGIQSFARIIRENYLYVDKTPEIYQLVTNKTGPYFFLSRPRRFGKSLLVSTLKELFLNNRELFKDLWIDTSDYSWGYYPVVHLDFSQIAHHTPEELSLNLAWQLNEIAEEYDIDVAQAPSAQAKFEKLTKLLVKKYGSGSVVILIDEYDKPILDHIENPENARAQQIILKNFYATIKSVSEHIKFIFLTGITKFSKTSVFSGLNNLADITFSPDYGTMLGYTQEELISNFTPHISQIAAKQMATDEKIVEGIRHWYNGYQFSEANVTVYNPYSVLLYLASGRLHNYWFDTGTPTFLIDLMRSKKYQVETIEGVEINILDIGTFDLEHMQLIPLLLQTGYLTISSYDDQTRNYTLRYPNEETKMSFLYYFMKNFTTAPVSDVSNLIFKLTQALNNNNLDLYFTTLESFFASIPYTMQLPQEKYYQSIFYIISNLIGAHVDAEVTTNDGRIDSVIITRTHVWIFEFKLHDSAQSALEQIEDKKYFQKYLVSNKKIVLIGAAFNLEKRNIENWISKNIA